MLSKLYKHEFRSLFRCLLPVYAGLVGLALFTRLFFLLDDKIKLIRVIQKSTVILFVLGIIAMFAIGFVVIVVRFYRHLLSSEGYLTLSLPFKMSQHILCKLVCGGVMVILNFICLLLSLLVVLSGYPLSSAFDELWKSFECVVREYGALTFVCLAELVLLAISTLAAGLLMTYVSMAIGQQFKNRIAAAVIAYICIYAALQTVSIIFISVFADSYYSIDMSGRFNLMSGMCLVFAVITVYQLVLSAVYFIVTNRLLSRRLNLA